MPYISKENVKSIRNCLKIQFNDFKFSVTCQNNSTVDVVIKSGPIDFGGVSNVNHYYINEHWESNPIARDFLNKVYSVMNAPNTGGGHEDSDYGFIPEYYKRISIGDWDKPYVITSK